MKITNGSAILARSLLAVSVAAASTTAFAAESSNRKVLEEIVVTAEHREVGLQETQISLSAFSADAIAQQGISNGLDIGEYVPNLNAQPYVGGRAGVSFNIRGVGNAETLITFDPAVSVYIDGVLIAKNTGSLMDVLELERIEVLRGPQGTLYGRNTMGGAVNYITKKPTDVWEGSLKTTLGKYGQQDVRGMLNIPLLPADSAIGELNLRASLASINRDGIQDNDFSGAPNDELGTKNRDVGLFHFNWMPTDDLTVMYSYDRTRIDEVPESAWVTNVRPGSTADRFGLGNYLVKGEDDRPDSISVDGLHVSDTEVEGHALNVAWELSDDMTLHSITGFRTMENLGIQDTDGAPVTLLNTRDLQENKTLSQEFRLVGSAVDSRLNYSVGLFYMDEEGDVYNETTLLGRPYTANIANYSNEAWAVYGQATYDITDRLDITFGIRYTEEDREMEKARLAGVAFADPVFLDDIRSSYSSAFFEPASKKFDNVSPMVSVSYDWTDDTMTYLKVSTGYQSGGFNIRDETNMDFQRGFDEETLISYELGTKSQFFDRFQVNAAFFFSDYDDKRVNNLNPDTLSQTTRNAGVVEIWGVEVELLAQLTDSIQAGFNYGHIDPKYVEYDFIERDGSISDRSDVTNFPFAPKDSYNAFVSYEQPVGFATFRARLDWSYRTSMTFLAAQPERNSSENAELVNARISLEDIKGPGESTIKVSAWGKNLTDEGYWNFGVNLYDSFGYDINTYGEPRTYGVDLEISF